MNEIRKILIVVLILIGLSVVTSAIASGVESNAAEDGRCRARNTAGLAC